MTQLPLHFPGSAVPIPGQDVLHARIAEWLDTLTERAPMGYSFECDPPRRGQKYCRIVMKDRGGARSVHAFYDLRTGEVYKAATWSAPAKHVRFSLLDDASFRRMLDVLDWSGGYLYIR